MTSLFKLNNLKRAKVIKRPSSKCKSPYVADILIDGEREVVIAHAPALGCNGLCDKDAVVLVSPLDSKPNSVCSFRIELAETVDGIIVGINPKLAEKIVEEAIMKSSSVKKYKREKTILNSRFDFVGKYSDSDNYFVLEVKTVPLCIKPGVSFFPHGYRKSKNDTVSPRAVKHIRDLIHISEESSADAIMCYVIQRGDSDAFIPSETDVLYKKTFIEAQEKGVKMKGLYVEWNNDGECYFRKYCDL